MRVLITAILTVACVGCGDDGVKPVEIVYTGKEANAHLSLCDQDKLPSSMTDLWVYDGGSFGGMIYYASFQCDTLDECWQAVRAFGAPEETEFTEGIQTRFAVNQHGPSFYAKDFAHPQWDVANIKDGVFHEWSRGTDFMDFWAIDRERLRVYFHHESGGFPDDPPSVRYGK